MELVINRHQTHKFLVGLRWSLMFFIPLMVFFAHYPVTPWVYAVFGLFGAINIVLTYFVYRPSEFRLQSTLWVIAWMMDLIVITMLLVMRDGIRTDIYNLFYLVIIQAGMLYGLRGAAMTSLASVMVYCSTMYYFHGTIEALDRAIIRSVYFLFVGVLVGYLAKLERSALLNSFTDYKTKLPNYKYFHDHFKRELEACKKTGQRLSVCIIDLDNFKAINTRYGHLVGDQILTELAQLLDLMKQEREIFARYGGEEFVVMNSEQSTEANVAERMNHIREVVENFTFRVGHNEFVRITLSMGLAIYEGTEDVSDLDLLGRADKALAQSKTDGKNRLTVWKGQEAS
jgi:diguanylate cyclase (GGDEF)-like protein